MRALSLLILCACGDKDDTGAPSTPSITQGILGTVDLPDYCTMPSEVDVWTALPDAAACDWAPEFDTGFSDTGHWTDNVGEVVDSPAVTDGSFSSELDAGDYEVRYFDDCYGCVDVTVSEGAVSEVTLALQETAYADAPNLYLYPEQTTPVSVRLAEARHIVAAEPDYPVGGWQVTAHPDGLLTDAGEAWDYLFYELRTPSGRLQREAGWCVEGHLAQASIEEAMALSGFLDDEIIDFSDFWDAHWPDAEWMTVYPQTRRLGALRIDPQPDALLRMWFVVEDGCAEVDEPTLPQVVREGFHAAEWGVVFDSGYSRTWDLVQ